MIMALYKYCILFMAIGIALSKLEWVKQGVIKSCLGCLANVIKTISPIKLSILALPKKCKKNTFCPPIKSPTTINVGIAGDGVT